MALRAAIFAFLVLSTPAFAQDASSSGENSSEPPTVLSLPDTDLQVAVRAAYNGAAAFASAHGNYFARDGVFPPLADAVTAQLRQEGFSAVVIPTAPAADFAAAKMCLAAPGTEMRIVTNTYGDGIAVVGVTDTRLFAYDYDPHKATDIVVTPWEDCAKAP
jgi:hypothetical protein